jgi:transcriptional regulator with XRE-family HTH domain
MYNVYNYWLKVSPSKKIDLDLRPFLSAEIDSTTCDWIWRARAAQCLSTGEVATRLNLSRSNYWRLETGEQKGSISIRSLRKVAKALNCELVYAIRPKCRRTFTEIIWSTILPIAEKHPWVKVEPRNEQQKYFALRSTLERVYMDARLRRALGWNKRKWNN